MSEKTPKWLYETTLKRQIDESVIEFREEQGQKIEIKRTVKKAKPIKLALLKPDRKLFKGAEMFYAKTLSEYLKAGLLPYSLVAKRYANDGGPLTEREKTRLKELREEARTLEQDFYGAVGDDEAKQTQKNKLLVKINAINSEIGNIENAYSDIFDSTAEIKARNDTTEWWSFFLIYIDEDDKGYKPIFGVGVYDEKVSKLEDYEDEALPFYIEAIKRLSYLVSFWFAARNTVTQIDFKTMEKLYIDTMSEYKIEETGEELKISEGTAPAPSLVAPAVVQPVIPTAPTAPTTP